MNSLQHDESPRRSLRPGAAVALEREKAFGLHFWAVALLAVFLAGGAGCSWTSSMLGFGDSSESQDKAGQQAQAEEQSQEEAAATSTAMQEDQSKESLVPRPERSKKVEPPRSSQKLSQEGRQTPPPEQQNQEQKQAAPAPVKPEKPEPQKQAESEKQMVVDKQGEEEEKVAPIKAKGAVPIEQEVQEKLHKAPEPAEKSKVYYATAEDLHAAIQKAIDAEKFLGYTDPFDAFPVLDGVDTMSAAFIPVDHPDHKVFYHAFFQPTKSFHKRVYGYTVIDMITNQDYGFFDGNADGTFEQATLDPKIVLDDYIRATGGEALPEAPEQ